MRILFVTTLSPTHYAPMVPLAWALRSAGHEVRVAADPALVDSVTRSGLTAATVGGDFDYARVIRDSVRTDRKATYWKGGGSAIPEMFARANREIVDDLVALARAWRPELVVRTPVTYAALVAGAAVGSPVVRHMWGNPDVLTMEEGAWLEEALAEERTAMFSDHGLTAPKEFAQWSIDPCPPSLRLPGPEPLSVRYVPYNMPGRVPEWLQVRPERPRICVTWGTFTGPGNRHNSFLVPQVLEALSDLDCELLVLVGEDERDLLGTVPENARLVHSLPLHLVTPSCSAVISHGGSNTVLTAAVHGVPQLAIAQNFADRVTAGRLAELGTGIHLPIDASSAISIRACVEKLLTDHTYRESADRLRAEIASQPSPAELVPLLEQIAADGPGSPAPEVSAYAG